MAISGATAALVRAGARKLGVPYADLAEFANLANAQAFSLADGTSKVCNATWTGLEGVVTIDWGDGTVEHNIVNDGSASHTYATTGAKHATIWGSGVTMKATVTLS